MADGGAHSQSPRFLLEPWDIASHNRPHPLRRRIPCKLSLPRGSGTFDRSHGSHGNLFFPHRTSVGVRLEAPLLRGTPGNVNHSISSRTPSVEALH